MSQLALFQAQDRPVNELPCATKVNNGEYFYWPNFFTLPDSNDYFDRLNKEIAWKQESMVMYGKKINFPRLTAWYGNQDKPYSFSGITLHPHPWHDLLLIIKSRIEEASDSQFNSVLLNLYRDGNDSISWHVVALLENRVKY